MMHADPLISKELQSAGAWDASFGDRKSTLVFIGLKLDREGILKQRPDTARHLSTYDILHDII